jgi:DNA-binding CsgD family transcriptional regulator
MYRESIQGMPGSMKDPVSPEENGSNVHSQFNYAMLEKLIEASPAFVYVYHHQMQRCIYASSNLELLFGHPPEALLGKTNEEMVGLVHSTDTDNVRKAETAFIDALYGIPPIQRKNTKSIMNYRLRRGNGTIAWVQQQKTVIDPQSKSGSLLVVSMITDISVTRKCHEFFSAIIYYDASHGWVELGAEDEAQQLSNREAQILGLLSKGKSSKIIANELSISVNTVNNHRKNMLLKTGANNIAELVSYGLSRGLI